MSEVSVFGFSGTVDGFAVAISMSLILAFLSAAHHGLTMLDKAVNKTAFRGAIQSLYKELVLMGVTSFIITLLSSAGFQFNTWLVYLQIADVVLFLSTIFHVLFSVALIFANGRHMQGIREDLAKDMHQLVKQYREAVDSGLSPWTPFSALRRQVELRVLRITFLTNYNLSRSFDFGRYITIAEENNIIEMLEVSVIQWMVFLGILIAVCVGFTLEKTDRYDSFLGSQCRSAQDFVQCKRAYYQCLMFTCGTGLMLMFTVGLAVASRVYTIRLIRQSGCELHELDKYILDDEMADLNDEKRDRISYKELKQAVQRLKSSDKHPEENKKLEEPKRKTEMAGKFRKKANVIKTIVRMREGETHAAPPVELECAPMGSSRRFSVSSVDTDRPQYKPTNIMDASSIKMEANKPVLSAKHSQKRKESQQMAMRRLQLLHAGIKSGVFLFDSPYLYFLMRNISLLLLCLFLSFFLITFCDMSSKTEDTAMWIAVPLITLITALFFQVYTIKSSSMIFSFYKLDPEILGRVVEEKEEIENIERMLREKLVNKLKNATNGESEDMEVATLQLFNEIQCLDGEADGYISSSELRVLLQRLNIHFTAKRFEDAFSLVDTSADGLITLSEFHAFIFPTDATEKKRATRILKMANHGKGGADLSTIGGNEKLNREKKRRTGLRNIMMSDQKEKKPLGPKEQRSSLIKFLQRPSLILKKNRGSILHKNDQTSPVTAEESLPGEPKYQVPITIAQMRDIESGDAWGEMFSTADAVKPSQLAARGNDQVGSGSSDSWSGSNSPTKDQILTDHPNVTKRFLNIESHSNEALETETEEDGNMDAVRKYRADSIASIGIFPTSNLGVSKPSDLLNKSCPDENESLSSGSDTDDPTPSRDQASERDPSGELRALTSSLTSTVVAFTAPTVGDHCDSLSTAPISHGRKNEA